MTTTTTPRAAVAVRLGAAGRVEAPQSGVLPPRRPLLRPEESQPLGVQLPRLVAQVVARAELLEPRAPRRAMQARPGPLAPTAVRTRSGSVPGKPHSKSPRPITCLRGGRSTTRASPTAPSVKSSASPWAAADSA